MDCNYYWQPSCGDQSPVTTTALSVIDKLWCFQLGISRLEMYKVDDKVMKEVVENMQKLPIVG